MLIICGLPALREAPGRALVDGAEGSLSAVSQRQGCRQTHTVGGLSCQPDQAELLRWYRHFEDQPPLVLIHGEAPGTGISDVMNQDPKTKPKALAKPHVAISWI